jgi:hypothetical protein
MGCTNPVLPMNFDRHHRPDCEGGHPFDSRSEEFQERKKTWRKCACYIFASGRLQGHYKRKYTGTSDWAEAKAIADQGGRPGSWVAKPQLAAVPHPVPAFRTAHRHRTRHQILHRRIRGTCGRPKYRAPRAPKGALVPQSSAMAHRLPCSEN